jgi:hypothetical protein
MLQLWNVTLMEYNVGEFLSLLQLGKFMRKTSMLYTKLSNINERQCQYEIDGLSYVVQSIFSWNGRIVALSCIAANT